MSGPAFFCSQPQGEEEEMGIIGLLVTIILIILLLRLIA
jgi:hypothetical protein